MRIKKSKIGIVLILIFSLIIPVFLNNYNYKLVDFRDKSFEKSNDDISKPHLSPPSNKRWWDSSYKYRIPINIANKHTSELPKGYSVNISVNTNNLFSSGKLRFDGKDLRVVWYNSSSETWLELDRINDTNFNTADTQIWFKTQSSISPSSDDSNYYLYYGNKIADNPPTNRSKVYDFYDDFTQSNGPADDWTVTIGTGWSVVSNEYRENEAATDRRTILDTYTVENATIEVRINHIGIGTMFGGGVLFRYTDGNNFYTSGLGFWGDEVGTGIWNGGTPLQLDGIGSELTLSKNNWYDLKIEMLGNQYDVYLNDTLKNSATDSNHLSESQIGFMTWSDELDVYFDDLKISLLVPTPPVLTVYNEEKYDSWYNPDWRYHKKITISSSSTAVPSDYSVFLTFDHESLVSMGKSRTDGNDVRVVFWNGINWKELDRMLDPGTSWNSNSSKIWFKTKAAIPAFSFDNNYYLYYGNPIASSPPNNGSNIFFFYDGFESGNLDGWDGSSTGSAGDSISASTEQVYSETYAAKCQIDDVADAQAMVSKDFLDEANIYAKVHIYLDPSFSISDRLTAIQFVDTSSGWQNIISVTIDDDMTLYMWNAVAAEAYGYQQGGTISKGTWHTLDVQVRVANGTGVARLWMDGNLEIDNTSLDLGDEPTDKFATGIYWANPKNETNTLFVDDVHLRIWVDLEPTTTLGTEEVFRPSVTNYRYYKELTIDQTKVSGSSNLINFPVFINITDSDLLDDVQSNGNDIAFYNGSEWLDHEIEVFNQDYNDTHAQLVAWVRIPSLSPSVDTNITMYYGNSTMGPQEYPTGVWDDNYEFVLHMNQDPSSSDILDSTSNGFDFDVESTGSMTSNDLVDGQIGKAISFDGVDDYIYLPISEGFSGPTDQMMFEFWIMLPSGGPSLRDGLAHPATSNGFPHLYFYQDFNYEVETSSTSYTSTNRNFESSIGTWEHIVAIWNGTGAGQHEIYVNGSLENYDNTPLTGTHVSWNTLSLCTEDDPIDGPGGDTIDSGERCLNAVLSEFRLSNIVRSADWIATQYNNQYNPDSFFSIGTAKSTLSINDFTFHKAITIDNTKVSGSSDLINFPILISIFDSDLHDHAQPDGDDIVFYSGNKWLDHEIELYNQNYNITHTQLVAWVRIPSLSSTVDTNITMYYGNSTMRSQENPFGVWGENSIGVWHLREDPSVSQIKDSTSNSYQGTSYGSMTSNNQVKGQIAGSLEFDGLNDYIDLGSDAGLKPNNSFTIEAWYSGIYNGTVNTRSPIYCSGFKWSQSIGIRVQAFHSSNDRKARITFGNGTNVDYVISDSDISDNTWTHLVVTYNGSILKLYINGTEQIDESLLNLAYNSDNATIGANLNNIEQWYKGKIDELRLLNKTCSADWIATEYNNQYDPSSFYTIGSEGTNLARNSDYFSNYKTLTIDYTKVSGSSNLINFPVLFNITDSDLHDDVQSNGNDIAFYDGTNWLDHEIELFNQDFNGTHAQLVTWVRIPSLSTSVDTDITMYYGNSTMGSQEYSYGVWEKNYVDVCHLNSAPTGIANDVFDSTFYRNDGITNGSMNATNLVKSKIGMGFALDGIDDFINISESSSLDSVSDEGTLSLWINWENVSKTGEYQRIMTTSNRFNMQSPTHKDGFEWAVNENGHTFFYPWGGNSSNYNYKLNPFTNKIWHHLIITFNYSNRNVTMFLDGSQLTFDYIYADTGWTQLAKLKDWLWGASVNVTQLGHFEGLFDEIRVSNIVRSANWITTEYANQNDPSSFYSIGPENQVGPELSISINSPSPTEWFNSFPNYSVSVNGNNRDFLWYTLDNGLNNYTITSNAGLSSIWDGTIDSTAWTDANQGLVNMTFYLNDTLGITVSDTVQINKDTIDPSIISIDSPLTGVWFSSDPPSYSLTITESNRDEIWYTLNSGTTNYTGALSGAIDPTAWSNAGEG
ncbi:MAG: DUF2341 domain-containing protein, partial [Candidatus Hodarchaeales archaeon]